MATQRPRHDDTSPFASFTLELIYDGPGPQAHDFQMRDHDVTLIVEGAKRTLHLLHLQNVRTDTVAAARAAVDDFLDCLEPTDTKRKEHTVFENFDKVRQELRGRVQTARAEVEDLYDELEWVAHFPKRDDLDKVQLNSRDDNPIEAVGAACEVFLEKLKLLDDSDEPRKRQAHTMHANDDAPHWAICEYMEAQAEKRGLVFFEWYEGSYPRDMLRKSGSRIIYDAQFRKDGKWDSRYGSG